jgi:DeoR/GlpR family transcriptional regulator of sugar metabolism
MTSSDSSHPASDLAQPERQQLLLERINQDGRITAARIATELGVSEDTIRRDLRELADAGLVQRFHGGAIRRSGVPAGFVARLGDNVPEKAALAARGLALIKPGMVVLLDQSTTLLALAQKLRHGADLTIITPAPDIALAALDSGVREVIQIGGRIDRSLRSSSGAAALAAIANLRPDLCFLGVCALDMAAGITALDHDDACMKRAMIEVSAAVVALVTADKVGTTSPFRVGPLSCLDRLISHVLIGAGMAESCRAAGVELDLVESA